MKTISRTTLLSLLSLFAVAATPLSAFAAASNAEFLVYFGTYTGAKSKGIYVSRFDTATGKLSAPELAAEISSPSFLAIHPNRRFLYAANEVSNFGGKNAGAVTAFTIDAASGKLTKLNQVSSGGAGPCYVKVDQTGKSVLVANYGGGSVAAVPIQPDGSVKEATAFIQHTGSSVNQQRQKEPHAHSINLSPDNRFAIAADLGLDKLIVYRFDPAKGSLTDNDPPFATVKPGSGPRHFAFHPTGRFAYVINEMTCTVTSFTYDSKRGELKETSTTSTLPAGETMKGSYSTAEVQTHPSGKFLYGSNRGHDTIAVFTIDSRTGKPTLIQNEPTQGKVPRNFGIDPTGRYLLAANQNSDNVVVFRVDSNTGRLTPTGQTVEVGAPVCVKFVPVK